MKADRNSSEYIQSSLEIIRCNLDAYRTGHLACYRVLAVELRLLLCDRKREHSAWRDIAPVPHILPNLIWFTPAIVWPLPVNASIPPELPIAPDRPLSLTEWLDRTIWQDGETRLSIRELIKIICEKDGGAHADPAGIPWKVEQTGQIAQITSLLAEYVLLRLSSVDLH